jgi:hypothetical protein
MDMELIDYFGVSLIGFMIVLALVATWSVGLIIYGSGECIEAGYPEAHAQFTGTIYCEKEVDGTEVVKPLHEIR